MRALATLVSICFLLPLSPRAAAQLPKSPAGQAPGEAASQPSRFGSTSLPLFKVGPAGIRPHLSYQYLFSDGLLARPGQARSTYIRRAAPGFLIELGRDWSADYTPTWVHYSNPAFTDTLDHSAIVRGGIHESVWALDFSSRYSKTSDPMVETGRQTGTQISKTELAGFANLGGPFSVQAVASQQLNFLDGLPDWHEWQLLQALHYLLTPTVDLSLGASEGYVAIYSSADMAYVRPHVEIGWSPSERLVLSARGGVEERKFVGGKRNWLETPILSASVRYQPIEATVLTLRTDRVVSPSHLRKESVETRIIGVTFSQRLLQHVRLQVGGAVEDSDYHPATAGVSPARKDRRHTFDARLALDVLHSGSLAVFYNRSRNNSNLTGYSALNTQTGVELAYRF